ncbi:hypothetical protein [Oscillatoria sp. HE19RPO]|uniref:hypothetical protein n=1 Tax=Oscillatoria sp. HE19RPO TaxID=2954806 RepID=UPI0020C2E5EF|nr:hypothetical protein [Oscillatoria sp. HE19RPO]
MRVSRQEFFTAIGFFLGQDLRIWGGQTRNVAAIRESPLHFGVDVIDRVSPVG